MAPVYLKEDWRMQLLVGSAVAIPMGNRQREKNFSKGAAGHDNVTFEGGFVIFVCQVPWTPGRVPSTPAVLRCPSARWRAPFSAGVAPFSPNRTPICEWLRLLPKALRPLPMVCVLFPGISKGYAAPRPYRGSGAALECGLGMNMLLWEVAGDESSRWCRMYALWCPLPKSPTHPAPLSPIPDPRSGIRDPRAAVRLG